MSDERSFDNRHALDCDSQPGGRGRGACDCAVAEIERLRERVADLEDERNGLIEDLLRAESEGYVSESTVRMEGDRG